MIEFKNISKSYGNQEVIKDFNLTIECGTFLTIIGSSGSGCFRSLVVLEFGKILRP